MKNQIKLLITFIFILVTFIVISKNNEVHASIPYFEPSSLVNEDLNYDGKSENLILDARKLRLVKASDSDSNQKEWTYNIRDNYYGYPDNIMTIGDLDLDASKEIVFSSFKYTDLFVGNVRVHAIDANGKDKPGWPVDFNGYHNSNFYTILADLNGDLKNEVLLILNVSRLASSSSEGFRLVALNADGSVFFDKTIPGRVAEALTYADIVNDPNPEIIVNTSVLGEVSPKILYFDRQGNQISEIPFPINDSTTKILAADIAGDVRKEFIYYSSRETSKIVALNYQGSVIAGFPKTFPNEFIKDYTIGDVNNDGKTDFVVVTINRSERTQKVYVYDRDNKLLPGYPYNVPFINSYNNSSDPIVITNVDADINAEIVINDFECNLVALKSKSNRVERLDYKISGSNGYCDIENISVSSNGLIRGLIQGLDENIRNEFIRNGVRTFNGEKNLKNIQWGVPLANLQRTNEYNKVIPEQKQYVQITNKVEKTEVVPNEIFTVEYTVKNITDEAIDIYLSEDLIFSDSARGVFNTNLYTGVVDALGAYEHRVVLKDLKPGEVRTFNWQFYATQGADIGSTVYSGNQQMMIINNVTMSPGKEGMVWNNVKVIAPTIDVVEEALPTVIKTGDKVNIKWNISEVKDRYTNVALNYSSNVYMIGNNGSKVLVVQNLPTNEGLNQFDWNVNINLPEQVEYKIEVELLAKDVRTSVYEKQSSDIASKSFKFEKPVKTTQTILKGDGNIANQDGDDLDIYSRNWWDLKDESWLGTGENIEKSYLGMRFENTGLKKDSEILSAKLVFTNNRDYDQWISTCFSIFAENSTNSQAFSSEALPSDRNLTNSKYSYCNDENWVSGSEWSMDITDLLKELQKNGNLSSTVSLIAKGEGTQYGRKFIDNHRKEGENQLPKLIIEYK